MNLGELTVTILSSIGQLVGVRAGTEQPRYMVVEQVGVVEIRHYGPRIAAEARVTGSAMEARNEGFRKVAGYIFGGNTARSSIAMTAPVAQTADGGAWRVQFIMPAKHTRQSLPTPSDPGVRLVDLPPQDYAVLRFSGSRSGDAVAKRTSQLEQALAGKSWSVVGEPVAWFYDPPWTPPFLRRNEVAAPVARAR